MKKIERADLPGITPDEIVNILNTGGQIVNASFPFIKEIFGKIGELISSIKTDNLSTPKGKRLAIEELQRQVEILQAANELQKQLNKIYDEKLNLS